MIINQLIRLESFHRADDAAKNLRALSNLTVENALPTRSIFWIFELKN